MKLIVRERVAGMTLGSDGDLYFGSAIENTNETGNQGAISRITVL